MQAMSFDICGWRVLTFAVKIAILTFAGDVLWHLQLIRFWHLRELWHLRLTCYDICGIMTFAVDVLWHLRLTCYDICGNFDISGRFWHLRALHSPLAILDTINCYEFQFWKQCCSVMHDWKNFNNVSFESIMVILYDKGMTTVIHPGTRIFIP